MLFLLYEKIYGHSDLTDFHVEAFGILDMLIVSTSILHLKKNTYLGMLAHQFLGPISGIILKKEEEEEIYKKNT